MKILSRFLDIINKEEGTFINDRRGSKRYDVPLKLNYRADINNCSGEALTKNICRCGLRFPVNLKIPKGTLLDLKIEDPHSNASICTKAKVIWVEEFISGDDAADVIYEVGVRLLKKRIY